jgi:hypothetical protein
MPAISPRATIPSAFRHFRLIDSLIAAVPGRAYVGNHLMFVQIRRRNVWDIWMGR